MEAQEEFAQLQLRFVDQIGVPVAGVQKTTIRTFAVNSEEENEGLRPHILGTKTPDFVHIYRSI